MLAVASDLFALMDSMTQRDLIIPVTIRRALDRMMPMIRFMLHDDGRLALFNGGTEAADGWAQTLLNYDTGRNKTPLHAQASGYHRIDCGQSTLIADTGIAPPGSLSTSAHAGCLSFELSAAGERIVVNCGASQLKGPQWTQAMRATAAHSTLSVADTSSAHIVAGKWSAKLLGPRLVDGPTRVDAKRRESEDGIHLDASHDAYTTTFGLIHERRWFVSHDGSRHPRRRQTHPARGGAARATLRHPLPPPSDGEGRAHGRRQARWCSRSPAARPGASAATPNSK